MGDFSLLKIACQWLGKAGAKGRISGFINPKSIVELDFLDLLALSTLKGRKTLNYRNQPFYVFLPFLWIFNKTRTQRQPAPPKLQTLARTPR
jgi:hypothetical protein